MFVAGGAAAEEDKGFVAGVGDFVGLSWGDGDGAAFGDFLGFFVYFHEAFALEEVVDFFGFGVVVADGAAADGDGGFGEALVADDGVAVGE